MKKFILCLFATMLVCLVSYNDAYAIKIKIKGSGGVVQTSGGEPDICPESSRDVCAVVEGSLWDLLGYWLGMVAPPPGGGPITIDEPVSLTVYNRGSQVGYFNQIQLLSVEQRSTGTKIDDENYESNELNGQSFKFRIIE
ncbi:MAG: hypothetical protein HUU34_21560 [Saprospiraceae bacterium]|nr:hypothetical protein [Saprospiraceae bacterium]